MTTSKPMAAAELDLIEKAAHSDSPSRLNRIVLDLVAEIRRQRTVLDHVDTSTQHIEAGVDRIATQSAELASLGAQLTPAVSPEMLDLISDLCDEVTLGHRNDDLAVTVRKWVIKTRKLSENAPVETKQE